MSRVCVCVRLSLSQEMTRVFRHADAGLASGRREGGEPSGRERERGRWKGRTILRGRDFVMWTSFSSLIRSRSSELTSRYQLSQCVHESVCECVCVCTSVLLFHQTLCLWISTFVISCKCSVCVGVSHLNSHLLFCVCAYYCVYLCVCVCCNSSSRPVCPVAVSLCPSCCVLPLGHSGSRPSWAWPWHLHLNTKSHL